MSLIKYIEATGNRYEIGFQHGKILSKKIQEFLNDQLFRINHILHKPVTLKDLLPLLSQYKEEIHKYTPNFLTEIEGLSVGAGITFEQALLIQIRREILGYNKISTKGDCTTFARNSIEELVVGQTVDLNGNLEDQLCIAKFKPQDSNYQVLMLTFSGLFGYLGMNDQGLAIGINLVLGGNWGPGIPPYLVIRHLLDTAKNVDECIKIIDNIKFASSRSLTLCDKFKIVSVEICNNQKKYYTSNKLVHTNHYLHQDMLKNEEINIFAKSSSIKRGSICEEQLESIKENSDVEAYFSILSDHSIYPNGICVHADGNVRREGTVAGVVMKPLEGKMYVRKGTPCSSNTHKFEF